VPEGDAAIAEQRVAAELAYAKAIVDSMARRKELQLDTAKTFREIEFSRFEFAIGQAKQWGASLSTIHSLESELSRRRTDAAIEDARREFTEKKKFLDQWIQAVKAAGAASVAPTPAGADEAAFRAWYAGMASRYGLNPNPDDPGQFYDYRGAFRAGASPDGTGHWPSNFKLPGHPALIVGGYDVRTGMPSPGADLIRDPQRLVELGWDPETAAQLVQMPPTPESVSDAEKELAALEAAHEAAVEQITSAHRLGEIERREEMRRTTDFWRTELGKRISGELRGALFEGTGRLFTTFFSGVDAEAKKQAKAAREDYERIKNSGRASAEEITRAFRAMRQAEEAANVGWANRFKSLWDGIKRHLFNIFDAILEEFVNGLLRGMIRGLANTAIGQRISGWLGKLIPGVTPGGGLLQTGAGVLGSVLGVGGGLTTAAFSTGAGGTLAASALTGSGLMTAATAVPGVSAAAAGGGAAAGAGTGAAIAALATNPITIAAAGVLALWATGLLSGGEGARKRQEAWLRGDSNVPDRLGRMTREQFLALARPKPLMTPAIDRVLDVPDVLRGNTGAAPPPTLPRAGGSGRDGAQQITVNNYFQPKGVLDRNSVREIWQKDIVPMTKEALGTNEHGLRSATRRAALE
jgi:hypothetical protein